MVKMSKLYDFIHQYLWAIIVVISALVAVYFLTLHDYTTALNITGNIT